MKALYLQSLSRIRSIAIVLIISQRIRHTRIALFAGMNPQSQWPGLVIQLFPVDLPGRAGTRTATDRARGSAVQAPKLDRRLTQLTGIRAIGSDRIAAQMELIADSRCRSDIRFGMIDSSVRTLLHHSSIFRVNMALQAQLTEPVRLIERQLADAFSRIEVLESKGAMESQSLGGRNRIDPPFARRHPNHRGAVSGSSHC